MAHLIPAWVRNLFPPPYDRKTIFGHYVPTTGAVCHALYSASFLSPRFTATNLVSRDVLVNGLFIGSTVGVDCYLFYGNRMSRLGRERRVCYSVFLATMFTCGTVVIFDYCRQYLPEDALIKTVVAVMASILFMAIGKKCYDDINGSAVGDVMPVHVH